ncbi:hypothetical protein Tco_0076467, partial [Tanacetum coccineum]
AEMEEENAKLWLFLKDITEYLVKEEGVADIETKKLLQLEDISTTEQRKCLGEQFGDIEAECEILKK